MSGDVSVEEPPRRLTPRRESNPPQGSSGSPSSGSVGEHAWERGLRWWHTFYATVLVAVLVLTLVNDETTLPAAAATVGLLAAIALWYALIGRLALHTGKAWWAVGYLAGGLALFVPTYLLAPWSGLLLMALCPQCFMLLPHRRAILACLAFNLAPAIIILDSTGWRLEALAIVTAVGLVLMAYAAAFGGWIDRIIGQSRERAELIEQLEATRNELAAANHEAGMLAERERLASEIHDTLAQGFTSVLMLLQAADSELDPSPEECRRHLDLAQRSARENLAEARTLVAALAPARLEGTSLVEALGRLVNDMGAALGVRSDFDVTGDARPLPAASEVVLLRATQEALANVRKHAGASRIDVRLCYGSHDDGVQLDVMDDGQGFEPAQMNGFGLRGMRTRAEHVGGRVDIESAPRAGTVVSVSVPCGGRDPADPPLARQ